MITSMPSTEAVGLLLTKGQSLGVEPPLLPTTLEDPSHMESPLLGEPPGHLLSLHQLLSEQHNPLFMEDMLELLKDAQD